jgi:hypothetical protein
MQQMECNSKTTSAGGNFGLALLALAHEHENLWMLAAGIQRHKIGEEIKHLTDRIMQEKEGHGLCDRETKTTKGTTLARAAERLNTVVKANLGTTTIHDQETGYEQILGRIETSDAGPRTETTRAARLNKKTQARKSVRSVHPCEWTPKPSGRTGWGCAQCSLRGRQSR